MIQASAGTEWREMYQVFNMGQRLEIFTDIDTAEGIIMTAANFKIDAQVTGYVEKAECKEVIIESPTGTFSYK